jgi:hypothetical protein
MGNTKANTPWRNGCAVQASRARIIQNISFPPRLGISGYQVANQRTFRACAKYVKTPHVLYICASLLIFPTFRHPKPPWDKFPLVTVKLPHCRRVPMRAPVPMIGATCLPFHPSLQTCKGQPNGQNIWGSSPWQCNPAGCSSRRHLNPWGFA